MGSTIDEFAKALASGASRRAAIAGLVAGATALLPWTVAGKDQQKRRRRRKRKFNRFLPDCRIWCGLRFDGKQAKECVDKAKLGKGPCYSGVERGPGFVCFSELACDVDQKCCTAFEDPVFEVTAECCDETEICVQISGTIFDCQLSG